MYWTSIKVGGDMLVDINLLPRKEKKKSWVLLFAVFCLAVLAAIAVFGWSFYQSQIQKAENLERELAGYEELRLTYESSENNQMTPTDELEQAVEWAQLNRKETYVFLQHITSLLPERGFIREFSYEPNGAVSLSVQFDSTRQAADYLHYLKTSSYLKNSELISIDSEQLEENVDIEQPGLPRYIANYQLEINLEALLAEDGEDIQ
jgi:type IV pilus assembly protein PilN